MGRKMRGGKVRGGPGVCPRFRPMAGGVRRIGFGNLDVRVAARGQVPGVAGRPCRSAGSAWRSVGPRQGRELAGPPQCEHVLQAGEDAGQCCEDQGVQRRHQPGLGGGFVGRRAQFSRHFGEALGQGLL